MARPIWSDTSPRDKQQPGEDNDNKNDEGCSLDEEAAAALCREVTSSLHRKDCERHASYEKLPRFWASGSRVARDQYTRLRAMAEARVKAERDPAMTDDELGRLLTILEKHDTLDYEAYKEVAERMGGHRALNLRLFNELGDNEISVRDLYNRLDRAAKTAQTRQAMRRFTTKNFREPDLERYVYDLVISATEGALSTMDEKFHAFYVFTAVRRFFFFLGREKAVSLDLLAASDLSFELHELARDNANADWFLPEKAKWLYSEYLEMDSDHNGMLSKAELLAFRGVRLTRAFLDRVFAEIVTYRTGATGEGEMDFKTFLDFVLAFDHVTTTQAAAYFWRFLDIEKQGFIDGFVINYFYREISTSMTEDGDEAPTVEDVIDEIFDMVKPENPRRITLKDLIQSGVSHTVITMLIDVQGFLNYDNREHLMSMQEEEDGAATLLEDEDFL